jgi:hypothetical protein
MLAEQMRDQNRYHDALRPNDILRPFAEVDIRFAEYIDWLIHQPQHVQDAVTLGIHLATAFHAKFNPLPHPPVDDEILGRVEEAQNRLGIDFLYSA